MAISKQQFESLLIFDTASWAFWSNGFNKSGCLEENPEDIKEFLSAHISEFKGDVVLLGLNRSNNKRKKANKNSQTYPPFSNFHGKGHAGDGLLSNVISKLSHIHNAFMTDLYPDLQSDSSKVNIERAKAFNYIARQLDILELHQYNIICFGDEVFATFQELGNVQPRIIPNSSGVLNLQLISPDRVLNCYKVIHYSYAVRFNRKERFKKQMETVNNEIGVLKKQSAA
jgi:hypothetical protein